MYENPLSLQYYIDMILNLEQANKFPQGFLQVKLDKNLILFVKFYPFLLFQKLSLV